MRRVKQFQDQSVAELNALVMDLSKEIYDLNNELRMTRKLDKPHLLREKRRDKARVLTVLRQKAKGDAHA